MSGDHRPTGGGRLPKQARAGIDAAPPSVTQGGDRVVVTGGQYVGQVGLVVGIRLVRDGGGVHRVAGVLLDAAEGVGVRLRHFTEGLLRVLD